MASQHSEMTASKTMNVDVSGDDNNLLVGPKNTLVEVNPIPSEDMMRNKTSEEPPGVAVQHTSCRQLCQVESTSQTERGVPGLIMNLLDDKFVRKIQRTVKRQKIVESVQDALCSESDCSLRVKEPSTVLCLDCSRHMTREEYEDMKKLAHRFVDSVDDRAAHEGKEQNIAVVCVSGGAKVHQHLTYDFSKVRDAIDNLPHGGKSTFFEAIPVSLAVIYAARKFDVTREDGMESPDADVRKSRLIFVTCGRPSVETSDETDDSILPPDSQMTLFRLVGYLGATEEFGNQQQLVWVPVEGADMEFLEQLAKFGGSVIKGKDMKTLAAIN